jgi:hypothetical protein
MSANSLGCFFMLLTILNLPIYLFYYQSNDFHSSNIAKDYFTRLSLANVANTQYACDSVNILTTKSLNLTCHNGLISELNYLGVTKKDNV